MVAGRRLIIVAAGGFAREVLWAAREASEPFDVIGFLDDDPALTGQELCDTPVLGPVDDWTRHDSAFVIAVGAPRAKMRILDRMRRQGEPEFATIVHRSVPRSAYVTIGEGAVVCAGSILTTQITIGHHAIVQIGATISHDVTIGNFANLAPQATVSGNVHIGEGAELGTSASVRQGLAIGAGAMIGMGSVLTKNVPANTLWMGNPAREVRALEPFGHGEGGS